MPDDKKKRKGPVPLSASERKSGVMPTGGSTRELINDAEDRLSFLKEDEETGNVKKQVGPTKRNLQKKKLRDSLPSLVEQQKRNQNNTTRIMGPGKYAPFKMRAASHGNSPMKKNFGVGEKEVANESSKAAQGDLKK